jgi:hypothetical protein
LILEIIADDFANPLADFKGLRRFELQLLWKKVDRAGVEPAT